MLVTHNSRYALRARQTLAEMVHSDWLALLSAAPGVSGISDRLTTPIQEALKSWTPLRAKSEFYKTYFNAVASLRARDNVSLERDIRALGSVLLLEMDLDPRPLPLLQEDGALMLPGMAAAFDLGTVECGEGSHLTVREIQSSVAASWIPSMSAPLRSETPFTRAELQKYSEETLRISRLDPALSIATSADTDLVEKFDRAYTLLDKILPAQAGEVRAVTEYIVPLRGSHFVGGSDITLFGASFLRLDTSWSVLCFADHIIHEAAHQLMHAHHESSPLLLNKNEIGAFSPIRADPRPLYGSFHATFVFLRLAQFMGKVLESGSDEFGEEPRLRFHRHLVGLLQGLAILRKSGRFSDQGAAEVNSWIGEARRLVEIDGFPDERLYSQLDWDYDAAYATLPTVRL